MPSKRTAGVTIYIQEELGDARLRLDELKGYIARALDLVNGSQKKDHLYAVAGDIICAIPETLLKAERAIEAVAMAVNKLDYEELRQTLRPEKVDELERVLENVRLRIPRRTGASTALAADACASCGTTDQGRWRTSPVTCVKCSAPRPYLAAHTEETDYDA